VVLAAVYRHRGADSRWRPGLDPRACWLGWAPGLRLAQVRMATAQLTPL